jgi:hypothetical protein
MTRARLNFLRMFAKTWNTYNEIMLQQDSKLIHIHIYSLW